MILRRFYISENTNGVLLTTDCRHSIYSPRPIKPRFLGRKLAVCSKHKSIHSNKRLNTTERLGLIKDL